MNQLLLVHGAFHGAWCWDKLRPELDRRGVVNDVVDLPFTSPEADVAAVRAAIDRLGVHGDGVTVLGHSFGGAIVSAAAVDDGRAYGRTRSLIYLSAVMMSADHTVAIGSGPGLTAISYGAEEASVSRAAARAAFYHRSSASDAEWAAMRLRRMPTALLSIPPMSSPAWQVLPSSYVVCTDDQVISAAEQEQMAVNAGSVARIDSDHSPFLACPDVLADRLSEILNNQSLL
jgi:pimeloyl-ACP methyl ester carboxylesterase